MADFPGCEKSVHDLNPNAKVCSEQHCDTFTISDTFHAACNTFGQGHPLYPVSTAQCIKRQPPHNIIEPTYDPDWGYSCPDGYATQTCYCCCSCLANGTLVAIPDGTKAIQLFGIGDPVTMGSYGKTGLSWKPGEVTFSSGSDAGSEATMVFIDCENGRQLIASIDHLLLLETGKLKRADRLVPGKDKLMSAEGDAIGLKGTHSGKWTKGMHHIAMGNEFNGTLDNHLLNTAGFVSGDFYLQVNQKKLIDAGLMSGPEESPPHGSADYAKQNANLAVTPVSAMIVGATMDDVKAPAGFEPFKPEGAIFVPSNAASFVTPAQAQDILQNGTFNGAHQDSGIDVIIYLIKVFRGFYPHINIVVDQGSQAFNAYAFSLYGHQQIVISGGIARLNGLYAEGYKYIMAQMVARLLGQKPVDELGFTYVAAADFYATSEVLRNVFYLEGDDLTNGVLDQIKTVFKLISAENAAGNPDDVANDPSIKCRYGNLQTGIFGGAVLGCACNNFALQSATAHVGHKGQKLLRLEFNKSVDPKSAETLAKYSFSSKMECAELPSIDHARVLGGHPNTVELRLDDAPAGTFTVTVRSLTSVNGSQLGDTNSASFTLK